MSLVNVSESAYLALHGLAYIAQETPRRISVKLLAQKLHASEATMAKVFQKLSKAGLVTSVRGPGGGFELGKSPEEITFLDIYEVIERIVVLGGCPFGKTDCAFQYCIFNTQLNRINQDIYDTFKKITLQDFVL
ncbi:MAG: Rrf2 family transcriptional regulator [Candidatus Cloacimonetes bacterium]|nr:Rrf2 family transcriptional regulator [Candidatus Cloacimonadota bacterium]